jgi:enamine deaminase RidA (YjgF/YER057c/UK114 family)
MKSDLILREDGFSLDFFNGSGNIYKKGSPWREELVSDENMYVLQETIIVPPHLINEANKFSAMSIVPQRCNRPLIFVGRDGLPVQYASVSAKIKEGKTVVTKSDAGIMIASCNMSILYSSPILGRHTRNENSFIDAFCQINEILDNFHMNESAIARTWLFMRDILNDYEELNNAREQFFAKWHTAANHFLPASTGIHNRITGNEILAFGFCAFSGNRVVIKQIPSPLQNEPIAYGKLFSRAVIVEFPKSKLLFISGTASIDKTGTSVYAGDFKSQMEFTLEIISAILKQLRCDFSNIVQAVIYLKREKDMKQCLKIIDKVGFPRNRSLFQVGVDVCRDNLLCEIEVTALIK